MAEVIGTAELIVRANTRPLTNGLRDAERDARGQGERIGSALSGGFASAIAGLGVGAAVFAVAKGSIDAAVRLETISRKLSNTLGPQGAGAALAFTKSTADELGLSFTNLAGSFGSFTAAATSANIPLEQQQALFSAVAKAGQALGLSNDEVNGSLLALQQVASKGTVQMEELRGQLGERLPIAFNATAKGLGITQQELIKLVETGKLTAAEFFPALTKGLNELTAGSGGAPTAAQNFAKFGNAWEDLQQKFGRNLLPAVVKGVEALTGAVEGLGVVTEAKELGLGGGLAGLLGFIPVQGAQAVGTLRQLQEQFGLTAAESQKLFADAAAEVGATKDAFGQLNPSAEQFGKILERLPELAKLFREANPDTTGELNKANAAAAKANELAKEREKTAKAAAAAEREIVQPTRDRLELLQRMQGVSEEGRAGIEREFMLEKARRDEAEARLKLEEEIKRAGSKAATDEGVMRARKNLEAAGNNLGSAIIEASEKLKANAKDAAERLKGAQQNSLSARVQGFDLLSDAQQQQVRRQLEGQIQGSLRSGAFDPQRVSARFGAPFFGGGSATISGPGFRPVTQNFGAGFDTSGLNITQLQELAAATKSLDDANEQLVQATKENTAAQKAVSDLLAGSGLTITAIVPEGVTVDAGALPVRYQ